MAMIFLQVGCLLTVGSYIVTSADENGSILFYPVKHLKQARHDYVRKRRWYKAKHPSKPNREEHDIENKSCNNFSVASQC